MLTTIAVSNDRSPCELAMPLGRLNLIAGGNGSGTSKLSETGIVGQRMLDRPAWHWPER